MSAHFNLNDDFEMTLNCHNLSRILVLIPIHNEAETIASVIQSLQASGLTQIRVIDNGSTDGSDKIAQLLGVEVVKEPVLGYGQSCWRGLQNLPSETEWLLFCDGDGSDDLSQLPQLLAARTDFDLILGNRRATPAGRAVLTPMQNFGSELAGCLIRLGWQHRYHDLGPLRLIRRDALEQLRMRDRGFGWTVEMQVRAIEAGLQICELPVGYRPRQGGQSKISGTLSGSIKAGTVILTTLASLYLRRVCRMIWTTSSLQSGLSALLILAGCLWIMPHGDFRQINAVPQFWIGIGLMSLGFVLSWTIRSVAGIWFWTVAILSRLLLLPMYPGDDIWRYLWEGYIQKFGFSPYHLAPVAPELMAYRTDWWALINHPDVTSIYPPIAQFCFWILASIAPTVVVFKLAFVLADWLICWLLSRRFGYLAALLYAWNPLVIYSFAGGGHYDSGFLLSVVLAWLLLNQVEDEAPKAKLHKARRHRDRLAGSALGLGISVAVKWISLPILGFLMKSAFRQLNGQRIGLVLLWGGLPFLLAAIPFCQSVCPLVPMGSVFVSHGRSAELIPYLVSLVWEASRWENWLYAIPLGFVILWLLLRAKCFLTFTEWYFLALLILSPIVHAWYFTWLTPFAVASRNWGTRLVSLSAFVYFALPYRQALGNRDWLLMPFERGLLWTPLILGWVWMVIQPMFRSNSGKIQFVETK